MGNIDTTLNSKELKIVQSDLEKKIMRKYNPTYIISIESTSNKERRCIIGTSKQYVKLDKDDHIVRSNVFLPNYFFCILDDKYCALYGNLDRAKEKTSSSEGKCALGIHCSTTKKSYVTWSDLKNHTSKLDQADITLFDELVDQYIEEYSLELY